MKKVIKNSIKSYLYSPAAQAARQAIKMKQLEHIKKTLEVKQGRKPREYVFDRPWSGRRYVVEKKGESKVTPPLNSSKLML